MDFIAREISQDTYVNIMEQYYPAYRAYKFKEIGRRISAEEFREAIASAKAAGLRRVH
jgi:putative pyruvate formate lyase activating enzyme